MVDNNSLLKEYELLQVNIHNRINHYWIIVGIYMSICTAILAGIIAAYISGTIFCDARKWIVLSVVLALGTCIIYILNQLSKYQKRIDFVTSLHYERMREIECELNMWANWMIHGVDNWETNNFSNSIKSAMQEKLLKYHPVEDWKNWKNRSKSIQLGAMTINRILLSIQVIWGLFMIVSLIVTIISR